MPMNTRYYHDPPSGYLVVYTPGSGVGGSDYEGRAAGIAGQPASCMTGGISRKYLAKCKRVAKRNVPKEWLDWLR